MSALTGGAPGLTVGNTSHGPWAAVQLTGQRMGVTLVPDLGGRIVSLVDRGTGRDWILGGHPPASLPGVDAPFTADVSYGWDDCLPSISPTADPLDPDGPALRDHGDQWGRPAEVSGDSRSGTVRTALEGVRWPYRFERRLRLEEFSLIVELAIQSRSERDLPFLWAAHPALALEPGTRMHMPGVEKVRVWRPGAGEHLPPLLAWPHASMPGGGSIPLDVVQPIEARLALKLFASVPGGRVAAEAPDGSWLGISWDASFAPYLGIWLDYGGWPADGSLHQVALEPTTAPADDLAVAIASGHSLTLPAGGRLGWSMAMTIGGGLEALRDFLAGTGTAAGGHGMAYVADR